MTIKDDTPGFYLNTDMHPNSNNPRTLPSGYDYEVPLSLNAETCLSEFRNIEKVVVPPSPLASARSKNGAKGNSSSTNVVAIKDEEAAQDTSDLLYNAY